MTATGTDTYTQFVLSRQRSLLRFAMVLTGDGPESDELVADVLARVYERWSRIEHLEQINAYVRRMIVNEFVSRRRRGRRLVPLPDMSVVADLTSDPAGDHAERDALLRLLAELPPKQRAAVVLRYYEGLPDDEIAQAMGCRASSVRSNISRALASLRISVDRSAGHAPASPQAVKEF